MLYVYDVYDFYDAIISFMDAGGVVLWLIAALVFVMWTLIFERIWYLATMHHTITPVEVEKWNTRSEIKSWAAHRIRAAIISKANISIDHNMSLIATLVALCPLLGLLGTVTGMIEVFTVLAITDNADVQAIASGVSKATIPTMAGMVAALSGLFALTWLVRKARYEKDFIQDQLNIEH